MEPAAYVRDEAVSRQTSRRAATRTGAVVVNNTATGGLLDGLLVRHEPSLRRPK